MLITIKLNTFLKVNLFFIQLRFTLKSKLLSKSAPLLNIKVFSNAYKGRAITLVKGPFAHKKSKEQFTYEYRSSLITMFIPIVSSPIFFNTVNLINFINICGLTNNNCTKILLNY